MNWRFEVSRNPLRRFTAGVGILAVSASLFTSGAAQAEVGTPAPPGTGQGIVGGALLGSEAVMLVEAAFGVQPWWAYAIGGGVGAIGGGIGGFFLAEADTGAAPMALLTAGLVLVVPTTIAILSATSYSPPSEPAVDDGVARLTALRPPRPPALFAFDEGAGWALNVPAVSMTEVYPARLRMTYGLPSEPEMRVPMLDVQF